MEEGLLKSGLHRLATDSFKVLLWQSARLICSYGLLLVLYKTVSPSGIARYANFASLTALAVPIFLFKPEAAVARAYYVESEQGLPRYIGSILGTSVAGTAICAIIVLVFGRWIEPLTELTIPVMLLLVPYLLCYASLYVSSTLIQLGGEVGLSAALRGMDGVLRLGLGVLLVVWLDAGWAGAVFAMVASLLIVAQFAAFHLRRTGRAMPRPGFSRAMEYVREGFPTVPFTLGMAAFQAVDRFAITSEIGLEVAGVYAFTAMIVSGIWLFAFAFQQAWTPWFYSRFPIENRELFVEIVRAMGLFFAGIAALTVAVILSVRFASQYLLDVQYVDSGKLVIPLAVTMMLSSFRLVVEPVFYFYLKSWLLSFSTLIGLLVSIILIFNWIGPNGAFGVGWAMASGQLVVLILSCIFAARLMKANMTSLKAG